MLVAITMLCTKCHQKEATVHFTTVVDGTEEETVHLCKDCAPDTGFDFSKLDVGQIKAMSVIGKKCEFCGAEAVSGEMRVGGGGIYWCFDCGMELAVIIRDLVLVERPDLLLRSKEESSFLSSCSDSGFQAWSAHATERATVILKKRRRPDD